MPRQPDARSLLSKAQPPSRAGSLPLVGGALCLDFANTSSGRGGAHRLEHLRSYDLLLAWCGHAGLLVASERNRLSRLAAAKPSAAARVLRRALALREAIHAIGTALARRASPPVAAVATVNRELGAAMARARLRFDDGGFVWDWASARPMLDQVLWPLARSAADLLTGPIQGRIKQCPGQHCGWIFLDRTKNRRRRWCEMEVCGARAKVRRYRERQRQAAAGPT
ncbi:MAG: CGNR zinc finger domain-containing protein [Pseudomonadota bacterium]